MDPRLLDEVVHFMNSDNLQNRYDHVILAGASLGVLQGSLPSWRATFFDHLQLAIELHRIRDIYVLEHRGCGAYVRFLQKDYGESDADQRQEEHDHAANVFRLGDEIRAWCAGKADAEGRPLTLGFHGFLMDLRGHVRRLADPRGALA